MPTTMQTPRAAGVKVEEIKAAILDAINQLDAKTKQNDKFFPFGINDLEITVKVPPIEVAFKLAGPASAAPKALGGDGQA